MPPPTNPVYVSTAQLGQWQRMLDHHQGHPEVLALGINPGQGPGAGLQNAVSTLEKALQAEATRLAARVTDMRESIGAFGRKLQDADDATKLAALEFEMRTPATTPPTPPKLPPPAA
jgi:hypothetical protein